MVHFYTTGNTIDQFSIGYIASTNQQIWRSIYEVIYDSYFKVVKLFPREFLDQCKNKKMNLRIYQIKSKHILKIWPWKIGCMHKWL